MYYIQNSWLYIGILIFIISLLKNNAYSRILSNILFLIFVAIASTRGVEFNPDTKNYVMHFSSFIGTEFSYSQLFSWGWGIGYNSVAILLTKVFSDKNYILFFLSFIPGIIFSITFYKYKYHSSIILFIYSTILLVTTTATIRHSWALSISFLVLNSIILLNRNNIKTLFYPMLFHYSTISLTTILIFNKYKDKLNHKFILIFMFLSTILVILGKDFIEILYVHFIDRATSGGVRLFGFRNILNLVLIILILFSFSRLSLIKKRLDFLLIASMILSIALMPFYGINRIVSFFTLIILIYFQKYQGSYINNLNNMILSIVSFISLIYFYLTVRIAI